MAIKIAAIDQVFFDKSFALLLDLDLNFSLDFDNLNNSNIIIDRNNIFSKSNKYNCSNNTTLIYFQIKRFYQFFTYITSYF